MQTTREREREQTELKLILSKIAALTQERAKLTRLITLALQKAGLTKAGLSQNLQALIHSLPTPPSTGWEMKKLGEVCSFRRGPFGGSLKKEIFVSSGYKVYEQQHAIKNDFGIGNYFIAKEKFNEMKSFELLPDDLIVSCSGTIGKIAIVPKDAQSGIINQALLRLRLTSNKTTSKGLKIILDSLNNPFEEKAHGLALKNVASVDVLKDIKIPLPPLEAQEKIIEAIEAVEVKIAQARAQAQSLESSKAQILTRFLNA